MYRAKALKPSQTPGRALGRVKSLAGWYIPSYTSERPRLPWLRSHDLRLVVTDISELRSVCAAHSAVWAWAVCLFNILSSSFSGIVVALVAMTTVLYKPWVHGGQMWPLFSYILIVFNVTFFYFLYHFFTFATCNAIQKLWNVVSFSNSLMFWICWSKKKKKLWTVTLRWKRWPGQKQGMHQLHSADSAGKRLCFWGCWCSQQISRTRSTFLCAELSKMQIKSSNTGCKCH